MSALSSKSGASDDEDEGSSVVSNESFDEKEDVVAGIFFSQRKNL